MSTLGERLKSSREAKGLLQAQLAKMIGVKSAGVISNWEKDINKPNADKMVEICQVLGISLSYLLDYYGAEKAPSLPDEAMKVAKDYWALDRWGRQVVRSVIADEKERCEDEARFLEETAPPAEEEPKVIPLYRIPAAAGYASPIFGSDFDYYTLKPEDPQGAVFAIRVQGDSMEPHFPDGSIAFCNKDPLQDGDIGVFCLDGDSFIKQYHYDKMMGMTYLFSLNRDRADADKLIPRTGGQTLTCFGRVMTKRRYPSPGEDRGFGRW